jgi:galactofuranose transport system permease protein
MNGASTNNNETSPPGQSVAMHTSFRPVGRWQKLLAFRLLWPAVALCLLLTYNLFFTPGFFKIVLQDGHLYGSLIDVLSLATPIAIVAIGMTLVIATGGVDLSVGSTIAITGAICALLVHGVAADGANAPNAGWPFFPAALVALSIAAVIGLWNGVLVSVLRIQPIIATLIMMVAGRGIAQKLGGGDKIRFADATLNALCNGYFFYLPMGFWLVLIVFAIVGLTTRRTALGLALECVGDAPSASRYVGLRVKTIQLAAYVGCAVCAGVAGLWQVSRDTVADPINAGLNRELEAIFAVVVGGTALAGGRFTLVGSVLGAVLLQTLGTTLLSTKLFGRDIRPAYLPLPQAIVIIVVCLLQSSKFRDAVLKPFRKLGKADT